MPDQFEQEIIRALKATGHQNVYVYNAPADEDDPRHEHLYDTTLRILRGDLQVTLYRGVNFEEQILSAGQELLIPRKQEHSTRAGPKGCTYIIAEKH